MATTDASTLAAAIAAAASPSAAADAVSKVAGFLRRHAADQSRAFFADAFPCLLFRLFVSSQSSASFLDLAAGDPGLADLLMSLLSPSGPLLSAAAAADRLALLRFAFPSERLPEWFRLVLSGRAAAAASGDVSPLLVGRVAADSSQLHLSVFEYYLFWFAYYPMSTSSSCKPNPTQKSRSRLESWVSTLAATSGRKPSQKPESSLYLKLLYAYLREFVPKLGAAAASACQQLRGGGRLLRRTGVDSANAAGAFSRAEFFVHTLVQFWLIGDDFSPLPVRTSRLHGLQFSARARAALVERPPTTGLGDAVKLLVMYLNCRGAEVEEPMVFDGSPLRKGALVGVGSETLVGYWNHVIQRPLYRFVLRTFLFCPMGAAIKNAAQVFSVWLTYMEPWKVCQEALEKYDAPPPGARDVQQACEGKEARKCQMVYTPAWLSYVMSNYLFYSSLVVHFLGFAHKFLHSDVASVLQMVSKVLEVLCSSTELLDLLYKVDVAYHSKPIVSSSYSLDDVLKYVPSIREQLQDWEDGLSESDADGSLLHEHWNSDLRLFSDDEDGAYNLLQLLLLRAESEVQRLPGDTAQTLQTMDLIRSQMKKVFHNHIESSRLKISQEEMPNQYHERGEVFTPKSPGTGKSSWDDVKYKGDWMLRPISETEVAWLVRILIRFSVWLNEALRLDGAEIDDSTGPTCIKFDGNELNRVGGLKDAIKMALATVCTWLLLMGEALLKFMRAHKMKFNLRVFASKKILFFLLVASSIVVAVVKSALS